MKANAVKSNEEIGRIAEACRLSSQLHDEVQSLEIVGRTEIQLRSWIDQRMLELGLDGPAYGSLIGSGENSREVHAPVTDRVIQLGDVVMIDAGGKWQGYCADITRSISAGTELSGERLRTYKEVLRVQLAAIQMVRPGLTLEEIDDFVKLELKSIGPMPHRTSHWIGKDVHDPCAYKTDEGLGVPLENGMVFTIEPGVYLENYGIRIEDVVCVENGRARVLSFARK